MRTLLEIKKEIEFNQGLIELIESLKTLAIAQFQALMQRKERFSKFFDSFESFFQLVDIAGIRHVLPEATSSKTGIIVITSDMGFMGGLNLKVIEAGLEMEKQIPAELVVIGEKGADHLKDLGKPFTFFLGITAEQQYEQAVKLKDYLLSRIKQGRLNKMCIVYPKPITFTIQKVVVEEFSCAELFVHPVRSKTPEAAAPPIKGKKKTKILIESSFSNIIEYLVGTWISYKLYEVFEDAKISEFASRTVHLEESHQNILQKNKRLRFDYTKSLHQLVDKNMRLSLSARE